MLRAAVFGPVESQVALVEAAERMVERSSEAHLSLRGRDFRLTDVHGQSGGRHFGVEASYRRARLKVKPATIWWSTAPPRRLKCCPETSKATRSLT